MSTPHLLAPRRSPGTATSTRVYGLDAVRALALLSVVVYHVSPALAPGGYAGVDVFFVVSGFLITTLLIREHSNTGRLNLRAFYTRRMRRLLPAAAIVVLVSTTIALAIGGNILVGLFPSIVGIFTFTQNWVMLAQNSDYFAQAHTGIFDNFWSLAIEEQFYLVWPIILVVLYRAGKSPKIAYLALAVAVACALPFAFTALGAPQAAYLSTFGHLYGLLLGVLMAVLVTNRDTRFRARPYTAASVGLVAFVAGAVLFAVTACGPLALDPSRQTFTTLAGTGAGALLVLGCLYGPRPLLRTVDAGPLGWLGRRSYGAYLWHMPLIVLADAMIPAAPGVGPLLGRIGAVLLSVYAAALSYRLVEEPIRRYGFRREVWRYWPSRLAACVVIVGLLAASTAVYLRTPDSRASASTLTGSSTSPETATDEAPPPSETPAPTPSSPVADPSTTTPTPAETDQATTPPAPEKPQPQPEPNIGPQGALAQGPMVAIGDSVMLASAPTLAGTFPQITVNAEENRQLSSAPSLVSAELSRHPNAGVVVIGLGINGTGGANDLRSAIAAAGDRVVVLLTVSGPVAWQDTVNDAIRSVAAEYPNVVVADWKSEASAHPDYIADDGIHPGRRGAAVYAGAINQALTRYSG
ncbi:MAG: acyltransferase family protein [Mycetocola sp.]